MSPAHTQNHMYRCVCAICTADGSPHTAIRASERQIKRSAVPSNLPTCSGKDISPPKQGKHFLHLDDFSRDELQNMLDLAQMAKKKFYARDESFKPFKGQTMAMIFTKPSARTRVSFETVSDNSKTAQGIPCELKCPGSARCRHDNMAPRAHKPTRAVLPAFASQKVH